MGYWYCHNDFTGQHCEWRSRPSWSKTTRIVVGASVGAAVLFCIIGFIIFYFVNRKRSRRAAARNQAILAPQVQQATVAPGYVFAMQPSAQAYPTNVHPTTANASQEVFYPVKLDSPAVTAQPTFPAAAQVHDQRH